MKLLKILCSTIFISSAFYAYGQVVSCPYEPISFEGIEHVWSHLTIDSTMIGYEYDQPVSSETNIVRDGMNHFRFDDGSFIHEGYIYSRTARVIGSDFSGIYLEKIDLETGELIWVIKEDIRTVDFREYALDLQLTEEKVVIHGVRETAESAEPENLILFGAGWGGYYYNREYDIHTGELLHYETLNDNDGLATIIPFHGLYNFSGDSIVRISNEWNVFSSGTYITKTIYDSMGRYISEPDTVFRGRWPDRTILDAAYVWNELMQNEKGHYYRTQQYSPNEGIDLTYEGFLIELDQDFNIVRELDIKELGIDSFTKLEIVTFTDRNILLHVCTNPFDHAFQEFCDGIFISLDSEFNVINTFKSEVDGELTPVRRSNRSIYNDDGTKIFFVGSEIEDRQYTYLDFYVTNSQGSLDNPKTLLLDKENWGGFVERFFFLDNGEVLVRFTHGCYQNDNEGRRSTHSEWFKFSAEDFQNLVSLSEHPESQDVEGIQLYPNPTLDQLTIAFTSLTPKALLIYNMNGNEVYNQSVNKGQTELVLNTESYVPGLYSATLVHNNGQLTSHRFVKM